MLSRRNTDEQAVWLRGEGVARRECKGKMKGSRVRRRRVVACLIIEPGIGSSRLVVKLAVEKKIFNKLSGNVRGSFGGKRRTESDMVMNHRRSTVGGTDGIMLVNFNLRKKIVAGCRSKRKRERSGG